MLKAHEDVATLPLARFAPHQLDQLARLGPRHRILCSLSDPDSAGEKTRSLIRQAREHSRHLFIIQATAASLAMARSALEDNDQAHVWLSLLVSDNQTLARAAADFAAIPAGLKALEIIGVSERIDLSPLWRDGRYLCHWLRFAGSTGPQARPAHISWMRELVTVGHEIGAVEFLGWGDWIHDSQIQELGLGYDPEHSALQGRVDLYEWPDGSASYRLGAEATGRRIDGHVIANRPMVPMLEEPRDE